MKKLVRTFSIAVVTTMCATTAWASLKEPIWGIPKKVTKDPWFIATLLDAYLGFLTFYGWVHYKERRPATRLFWFASIMLGGNAAMSTYTLLQLMKLPEDASFSDLLLRSDDEESDTEKSDAEEGDGANSHTEAQSSN